MACALPSGRLDTEGSETMDSHETVRTFLDYYRERGHQVLGGDSLIPPPGDSVLFTTSGMHHLTPYLEGRPHPLGQRLTSVQRCLRTTDLEEVGDRSHLTVFSMLGSWSLGDYGSEQSLRWGYGLLCEGFGIRPSWLHVTVFGGDEQVGPDVESLSTWGELGVPVELTGEENWWSNGPTGPCGPDSEIFVWTGDGPPVGTPTQNPGWVEVWNHVMMRYLRREDGGLVPLPRRNIDTGMGLERLLTVLQGTSSVFLCDVFEPWLDTVPGLWGLDLSSERVVVDHLRSSIVIIGDGVTPSTTGRGYVLRRLLRRVLTILWRDQSGRSLDELPVGVVSYTLESFGLRPDVDYVRGVLLDEERRFSGLLDRGRKVLSRMSPSSPLGLDEYRYLHETHGLPRELVDELLVRQV